PIPPFTISDPQSWNEQGKALQDFRKNRDNPGFWNKRAQTFTSSDAPDSYVAHFLDMAKIKSGQSVLDMGCGTGALAIPLAKEGHEVIAADFSSGMLAKMEERMRALGVTGIRPLCMKWEDDWERFGIYPQSVDVGISSRSIGVYDLLDAVKKIDGAAKSRVCISVSTGGSPRIDGRIAKILDLKEHESYDYLYLFGMVAALGVEPEVSYIKSARPDTFEDEEEAFAKYADMTEMLLPDAS
ncbi:MAG: class I SAM-dependent methyltransferase, partial [Eggerthellaceae bacterium]|nr:class I SAM-dependent methyltransferase [Eggerthellaceae bacterium]